jgi:hypothetical protein
VPAPWVSPEVRAAKHPLCWIEIDRRESINDYWKIDPTLPIPETLGGRRRDPADSVALSLTTSNNLDAVVEISPLEGRLPLYPTRITLDALRYSRRELAYDVRIRKAPLQKALITRSPYILFVLVSDLLSQRVANH